MLTAESLDAAVAVAMVMLVAVAFDASGSAAIVSVTCDLGEEVAIVEESLSSVSGAHGDDLVLSCFRGRAESEATST